MGAPITIQSNIKSNTKSFDKFGYFLGGIDVTHQNLDQFTPYIRGVSRIFLHKPPAFMLERYPDMTRRFKTYLESAYTSVDGLADISVDFTDFEGGFAGQRFSTVSLARDETESITIQLYELSGSPVREYLDTWVTGVRDPRSVLHTIMVSLPKRVLITTVSVIILQKCSMLTWILPLLTLSTAACLLICSRLVFLRTILTMRRVTVITLS